MRTSRPSIRIAAGVLAILATSMVTLPMAVSAAPRFTFGRTDYLLHDRVPGSDPGPYGVDSVAVGDLAQHMRDRQGLDTQLGPTDVVTILAAVSGG